MRQPPANFHRPDYSAPFDLDARINSAITPRTIKGFLMQSAVNAAKEAGNPLPPERKYVAFKDYSSTEAARLYVEIVQRIYPELPIQEGLRRLGQRAFGSLSDSVLGRVLLGTVGLKLETALRSIPRVFELVTRTGIVSLLAITEDSAHFRYEGFSPDLIDCYQVGVLEGGLRAFGKTPEVYVYSIARGEAELWCTWS